MKRLLIALLIAATTFAAMMPTAEAKRLGGGASFGRQSAYSNQNSATPMPSQPAYTAPRPAAPVAPVAPAAAPGAAIPPKPASPWRGIVGGALLGLGLGALFSHFGMGGAMGGILMFAVIAFAVIFLIRMLSRRSGNQSANEPFYVVGNAPPQPSSQTSAYSSTPEIGSQIPGYGQAQSPGQSALSGPAGLGAGAFGASGSASPAAVALGIPAGFDVAGFLRNAKSYFIRLQAAGDKADIHDIREFTTPEVFAELRLQIQERGASPNVTDVVQLNAELLGIEQVNDEYLATVRFGGLIKEAADASAEPFIELWNFSKPVDGASGWVLAGIQQAS
ncbi:MAG TPA: Tim44-like domain-containing protein [Herbaspirillum sp.]|nr:Tim44-like domain-containing protein [Herbaspirillum sp.]